MLESFAPVCLQETYDNTGIQVGDIETDISGILITVDITEDTLDEAIENGCNMIVAHHPLLFKGLKKVVGSDYVQRVVIKAVRNDMVLYAAHTNLDKCAGGVSWRMAEWLGLKDVKVLVPDAANPAAGLGCVGNLVEPMTETDALMLVKSTFKASCVRHSACTGRMVRRIAVCGGSGAEFINQAIAADADLYVTGDIKYHDFFNAENKIVIADIGHFESEQVTKEIFYAEISKLFPKFAVRMSDSGQNAVCYI